jgi:hypothetical protein
MVKLVPQLEGRLGNGPNVSTDYAPQNNGPQDFTQDSASPRA